jgi:hypothetical protein
LAKNSSFGFLNFGLRVGKNQMCCLCCRLFYNEAQLINIRKYTSIFLKFQKNEKIFFIQNQNSYTKKKHIDETFSNRQGNI